MSKIIYEFGGLRLDPRQRLLSTAAGDPVSLAPRAFETLLHFVERPGELIEKRALMAAIWPNVMVEENSLNQVVAALRRALGEGPREHRFIVTEPGRGFRFVADVAAVNAAPPEPAQTPAPQTAPQAPARKSIAVMPFANHTGDASKDYLCDGLAAELIHTLARIPGMKVPSHTSVFAYKGRQVDARQIARDLEVAAILEGSVRSAGERIRISAQLIDAQTGFHLWSGQFDRKFEDLFALQDEMATVIAVHALHVTFHGAESDDFAREAPTRDLEAYLLYMKGLALTMRPTRLASTIAVYRQAIARDPGFARARGALAVARSVAMVVDTPAPDTLADAERETLHALELNPKAGGVHAALGVIQAGQARWMEAEACFLTAIDCDPGDPTIHLSFATHVAGSAGHLQRCLDATLRAHRLAPAWVIPYANLAVVHQVLGQDDLAVSEVERAIELGASKNAPPLADILAQVAARAGRYDEAGALIAESVSSELMRAREAAKRAYLALGDKRDSARAVAALDEAFGSNDVGSGRQMAMRRLIVMYSMLGALDRAHAIAVQSLDEFAPSGSVGVAWTFIWMPELAAFRADARFQDFAGRLKLPDYWRKHGPPDGHELRNGELVEIRRSR